MAENSLYSDPALIAVYDALNASREDTDFYLSQLPNVPQRVLDIGCGTGQFALELAARGHDVCAVDPAPGMVAYAREKPGAESIEWYVGRCCVVPKSRPFDFIFMTGHAFQCLLSDQDISRLYAEVVARLASDGVFFDPQSGCEGMGALVPGESKSTGCVGRGAFGSGCARGYLRAGGTGALC